MKTPAGRECTYFYGNYHRGRNDEECRLMPDGERQWTSKLCQTCPMPGYQRANNCEHMRYQARIEREWQNLWQPRVKITANCVKSATSVKDPHIGCGQCHPVLNFVVKDE